MFGHFTPGLRPMTSQKRSSSDGLAVLHKNARRQELSKNIPPIKFLLQLRHRILEATTITTTTTPRTSTRTRLQSTTKLTEHNMPEAVTALMEMRRKRSAESMKAADETNTTSESTASGETASTAETSNDQSSSSDAPQDQKSDPSEGKKD